MRDVPENELLSAYLDGELTAAEQAEVERLLAASPAARQLLEGLKALSATLQSLPVHKLDEDLSDRVLRVAERQMLAGPGPRPRSNDATQAVAVGPVREALWRRLTRPRTLFWPAAAAAIAVLILVLDRGAERRPAADKVALGPARVAKEAPAEAPTLRAAPKEVDQPAESVPESRPATESLAERAPARPSLSARPRAREAMAPVSAPGPASPPAAPAAPTARDASSAEGLKSKDLSASEPDSASIAKSADGKVDAAGGGRGAEGGAAAGQPMKAGEPAMAKPLAHAEAANGKRAAGQQDVMPLLVVRCDVTAEDPARAILQRVFGQQSTRAGRPAVGDKTAPRGGIAGFGAIREMGTPEQQVQVAADSPVPQETPHKAPPPLARKITQDAQDTRHGDAARSSAPAVAVRQRPEVAVQRQPIAPMGQAVVPADRPPAEVYLEFEASPGDVQAALAEVKARRDVFSAVAVEPAPGEARKLAESGAKLLAVPTPAGPQASLAATAAERPADKKQWSNEADRTDGLRRVLFVLRVAPSGVPGAADLAAEKAAEEAEKAAKAPAVRFEAKPPAEAVTPPAAAAPAGAAPGAK